MGDNKRHHIGTNNSKIKNNSKTETLINNKITGIIYIDIDTADELHYGLRLIRV